MDKNDIIIMGDVHADFGSLNKLINKKRPKIVLQCGDFGYWPRCKEITKSPIIPDCTKLYWCDGTQYWYVNGKLHRDNDLPAIIWADGTQCWYQHGKQHRFNNPAVICVDGYVEYWYNHKQYSKQQYFDLLLAKGLILEKEHFAKLL